MLREFVLNARKHDTVGRELTTETQDHPGVDSWKNLMFWIGGRLREVIAHGGWTVVRSILFLHVYVLCSFHIADHCSENMADSLITNIPALLSVLLSKAHEFYDLLFLFIQERKQQEQRLQLGEEEAC